MDKLELNKVKKALLLKRLNQKGYSNNIKSTVNNNLISKQQLQQLSLDCTTLGKSSILTWQFTLDINTDLVKLENSFKLLIHRHPLLSTIYTTENSKINLIETKKLDWEILNSSSKIQINSLDPVIQVPMRIRIKKDKDNENIKLIISLHHIAADEISWQILLSEISYYYNNQKLINDGLSFSNVQPNFISEDKIIKSSKYWKQYLATFRRNNDPFSVYRNNINNLKNEYVAAIINKKMSHDQLANFKNFAQNLSVSPITLLIASVALVLETKICQPNIIIGTAVDQREQEQSFKTIGNFVAIIPIIVDIINCNLQQMARKIHQDIILGFKNRFINLEDIISNLNIKNYSSRHALIDFIVLYRQTTRKLTLDNKEYLGENVHSKATLFDLIICIDEDNLNLTCEYKSNLIPKKIALQILDELFDFINNISYKQNNINITYVQKFSYLIPKICQKDIINQFIKLVNIDPNFIAVEYLNKQFTRLEILTAILKLSLLIKNIGLNAYDKVVIATSRSIATPICYLAALYCEIIFIPLDITQPKYRLLNLINNSNPKLIIIDQDNSLKLNDILDNEIKILKLDILNLFKSSVNIKQCKRFKSININQPAYIIFTSGTTGAPKGVLIARNSLNVLLQDMGNVFGEHNNQSYLSLSTLSFDISIFEILFPLYHGMKLIIGEVSWYLNPQKLASKIKQLRPNIIELTPSLCNELLYYDQTCISGLHVCCGGEKLSLKTLNLLLSNKAKVSNLYGPTEMTIIATEHDCKDQIPAIGKALKHVVAVVLDNKLREVADGFLGQLYLFGEQIAQYYVNDPCLSASKFVANPFCPNQRMYRTGDLVYKDVDTKDIHFCGRDDNQLSIHGARVEVEEIECAIANIADVEQCAIKIYNKNSNPILHGYFSGNIDPIELELELKKVLPNYLRPVSLNKISNMPKSASGKIDKNALPDPQMLINQQTLPNNQLEILVADSFKEILGINEVKNQDNFFFLGGYSLQITSLINSIEKKTSIRLTPRDIFDHPTIEEIALILLKKSDTLNKSKLDVKHSSYSNNIKFKLSDGQKRILTAHKLNNQKDLYNMPLVLKIDGKLNAKLFKSSLILLLKKHKILCSIYNDDFLNNGIILPWSDVLNKIDSIFYIFPIEQDILIKEKINNFIHTGFKLDIELPIKIFYFPSEHNDYLLFLLHHVVADEFSLKIIFNDLENFYNSLKYDHKYDPNQDNIQYFNVIQQLNQYSPDSLQFWQNEISNIEPSLEPPFSNKSLNYNNITYHQQIILSEEQTSVLQTFLFELKASPYHVLIAMIIVLVSRLTQQKDVTVGAPVLGRANMDHEKIVGYFSNTLPIRVISDYNMTGKDCILATRNTILQALEHFSVPLEKICSNGIPFSVFIDYRSYQLPSLKTQDFVANALIWDVRLPKFPVIILYDEINHKIDLLFSDQFYQENSSVQFKQALCKTLDFFCKYPTEKIAHINYYDVAKNLYNFNYQQYFYQDSSKFNYVFTQIEQTAMQNSNNIALSSMDYNLKYYQLLLLISKISTIIHKSNLSHDDIVVVYSSKTIEQLILMMAVLHAGFAYVVLDANYPQNRIKLLLQDINTKLILNSHTQKIDLDIEEKIIDINNLILSLQQNEVYVKSTIPIHVDELAYLCFTSGTTGVPKGVLITHKGLSDFVCQMRNFSKLTTGEIRLLLLAPMTFDLGFAQALFVFANAGHMHIVDDYQKVGNSLLDQINQHNITHLSVTPSVLETLSDDISKEVVISVGAEKVNLKLFSKWSKNHIIINLYGPTETTINALSFISNQNFVGKIVPVGVVDIGMSAVILDDALNPVPVGVKGELYLGGTGIARGYLNNFTETATKFVASPFEKMGSRIYRTGDLASIDQNGNIVLYGRIDEQFKIRGIRIEPSEIENACLALDDVLTAVALVLYDDQRPILTAIVVRESNNSLQDISLEYRKKLKNFLPQYLIPQVIVAVEKLPLTDNGKVDKKAIYNIYNLVKNNQQLLENKSLNEKNVLKIIVQELSNLLCISVDKININHNFLEIGADSIVALQLIAKLKQSGYDLSVQDLFESPSIKELSVLLDKNVTQSKLKVIKNNIFPEGDFEPLPIVKEYLSTFTPDRLFAYSLIINAPLDIEYKISNILQKIIFKHTALRTRYISKDKLQTLDINHSNLSLQIINFDSNSKIEFVKKTLGNLLNPVYAKNIVIGILSYGEKKLLLLMVHHLASDIVSLKIILNDLKTYYNNIDANEDFVLSLRESSIILNSKLNNNILDLTNKASIISKAFDSKLDIVKKAKNKTIILSPVKSERLFLYLKSLSKNLNRKISLDIFFIFIISKVIGDIDYLGLKTTTIDLETHGRDNIVANTVGWFTKIQKINCLLIGDVTTRLKYILDQMQDLNHNSLNINHQSNVLINYIGLLDKNLNQAGDLFTVNQEYDELSMVYDDNLPLRNPVLLTILEKENNQHKSIVLDFIFASRLINNKNIQNFINLIIKEVDITIGKQELFKQYLPVTYTQEGLIQIENENIKGKKAYVINMQLCFKGKLDVNKLYVSFMQILTRHIILRASFHQDEKNFYAKINTNNPDWEHIQLSDNTREFNNTLQEVVSSIKQEFNINEYPLHQVRILSKGLTEHVLIFCLHHILADGWSAAIIMQDLFSIYNDQQLEDIPDIANTIKQIKANINENTKIKWRKYLRGAKPTYITNYNNDDGSRDQLSWVFSSEDVLLIQDICKYNQITLSALIHALWAQTLMQITQSKIVSFGSVTAGRPSYIQGINNLVDLFANSIPILANGEKNNILEIAKQIGKMLILASQEALSLSQLLQISGHNDLFDTLLVLENYPIDSKKLFNPAAGLTLEKYEYKDSSHYPLTFIVNVDSKISCRLSFSVNAQFIISISQIKKLFIQNFNSLNQVINLQKNNFNKFSQDYIFNQLNATSIYGISITGKEYYLNVNQCEYYLSQLTRKLIALGAKTQKNIILSLPKSIESVLLIIAIFRSGACLVPVDIETDKNRYLKIIDKVNPHLIINLQSIYQLELDINFEDNIKKFNKFTINERIFKLSNLNYAYIIHTSGTTGEPKGIYVSWNILNYLLNCQNNVLKLDKQLTIAHFAPNYFDVCIQELLTAFIFGHHLVIVAEDKRKNINELALFLQMQQVDVLFATNLIINELASYYVNKQIPNLSYLIQSGEKLEISKNLNKWCSFVQGPKLINHYGPSETHVVCFNQDIDVNCKDDVAIGKEITGTKLLVLDSNLCLSAVNQVGEIYILGESISYGYVNDSKQTAMRYVPVPNWVGAKFHGKRMYRTGDLAYYDDKDLFYCLGRIDEQVKVNGIRVELQEIIQALTAIDGISQAFVITNLNINATALLAAVILDNKKTSEHLTISSIKQKLIKVLAKNLIPSIIKIVTDVPLNKNNKLDKQGLRKILLSKDQVLTNKQNSFSEYDLSIEVIKSIMNFVLDTNINISNEDDFFALGGHSLLATKLANQINNVFNSNIKIKDIFQLRTPINIFQFISNKNNIETDIYEYQRPSKVLASSSQLRFWMLCELGMRSKTYHIPLTLKLFPQTCNWNFDKLFEHFKKVILKVIFKHEALRTIINFYNNEALQVILNENEVLQKFISIKKTIIKNDLDLEIDTFHSKRFNLSSDVMLRFGLFNLHNNKNNEYILLITMHHICCDAWSISIILNDIKNIFEDLNNNYTSKITSYIDEIGLRDKKLTAVNKYEQDLNYWEKNLLNISCPLNLPLDYIRTSDPKFQGDILYFDFGEILGKKLFDLAQQKSVTYFMLIQASIAILLHKISFSDDIVIGVPDSGRQDISDKNTVGCFINLLVLRFDLSGNPSFDQIIDNVRKVSLDAYAYNSVAFDVLVRTLGFSNVKAHHPLFTVGVGLQYTSDYQFDLEGFNIEKFDYHPKVSRYDVNFDVILDNENKKLKFIVEYDTNLFKQKTIYNLMDRLKIIIESAVLNSSQNLADFNILLKEERFKFYKDNNNYIFAPTTNFNPQVINIVHGELSNDFNSDQLIIDSRASYTYKYLKHQAHTLAKILIENKINFGDNICIICSRSFSFYVGVMAILRVGATYVPLLPDYPIKRLNNILQQTQAKILITDQQEKFNNLNLKIINISLNGNCDASLNNDTKLPSLESLSLKLGAYIIFTSGTTGKPKGILINRYSLACMLDYMNLITMMDKQIVYLSLSAFCFDLGVYDVLGALSVGARIYIIGEEHKKDPTYIKNIMNNCSNSASLMTPSLLSTLVATDDILDGFKRFKVFLAGEGLAQNLAQKILNLGSKVWSMYGPAESVIVSNGSKYKKGFPSLGADFRHIKTYVLDKYLNPVPNGVIGQIYIAGEQLANCYIENKSLTASKFVANKFFKGRMYCSGDLGFIKNNNLYFAGRIDNQVTIRGHRVEIEEITQALNSIVYIKSSVVKVIKQGISTIIVAYIILDKHNSSISNIDDDIKNFLAKKIPEYMMPNIILKLDTFPLTINGKVDLNLLPFPAKLNLAPTAQTPTQKLIVNILSDLLKLDNPNIDANFIALGIDSISVIILANKLSNLGFNCSPKMILDYQTIKSLAKYLDETKDERPINNITIDANNLINLSQDKLDATLSNWSKTHYLKDKDE